MLNFSSFRTFVLHLALNHTWVLWLLALLAVSQNGIRAFIAQSPGDSSVVLITLDTTRADHLSCYAPQKAAPGSTARRELAPAQGGAAGGARTPHLDALAARGVRFAHATAQVPLTLPSHACIMTGAYPPVHGLRDMGGFVLEKTHPTIASIARSAGFETAAFVGSRVLSSQFGLSNGFTTYDDDMKGQTEEGLPGLFPERRASVVTDRALQWLKKNGGRKFVLWVHYYDPHAPYAPPEPYKDAYARDLYSGEIAYMDEQVGRLLDGIKELSLSSHTLIVAMGDHGESLGEHGEMTHGVFLYDSTLHVPLIIAGPGVPAGRVIDEQVRSIDVMPTILGFLQLSPGNEAQGVNLWPLVEHRSRIPADSSYLETIYPRTYLGWSELRGMRTDKWAFISAPRPELYDLESDPAEMQNIAYRHPEVAHALQARMWAVAGLGSGREQLVPSALDEETRRQLNALGYVSAGTPRRINLGTAAPDPKDRVEVLKILDSTGALLSKERYAEAAKIMERCLPSDPTNPLVHIYLATALDKMGDYRREVQVYQDALAQKIETGEIDSRLGKAYLRLQELDKAVEAMTRAVALDPLDLDSFRNLGTAQLQLGRVGDAEKAFQSILVENDHYSAAYNGLGLVAIQRGNVLDARRDFEKAIEVGPDEVEPLLNLGLLYQKSGEKRLAIRYYQMFLSKAPEAQYGTMFADVRKAIKECQNP
ncbi:MAG TPA: sulfatase-like hydrolase/transferase [Terriglobia bacterium]|nr:sulfatase-like hydrolase/transferase [Terriglobia bacterium]